MSKRTPWYRDTDSLRAHGFTGFVSIQSLRDCKLECVPKSMGVYVVLRPVRSAPKFLESSTGGWIKKKNPSVSLDKLEAKWLPNSQIIYIGKAGTPGRARTLRQRIGEYLRFGTGQPIGHWGGRYIWHLPESENLLVGWKPTPGIDPEEVEKRMLVEFYVAHGSLPFANLRR